MCDLKGPEVDVDLHLELPFEIRRYSPRVLADATSTIFEFVLDKHVPILIDNSESRCRQTPAIQLNSDFVFLATTADDDRSDCDVARSGICDFSRYEERRAEADSRRFADVDFEEGERSEFVTHRERPIIAKGVLQLQRRRPGLIPCNGQFA